MMRTKRAQTAIEYILLLMTVVVIVLIGFKAYMPSAQEAANLFYNRAAPAIFGEPPHCGDGVCGNFENLDKCPPDCS